MDNCTVLCALALSVLISVPSGRSFVSFLAYGPVFGVHFFGIWIAGENLGEGDITAASFPVFTKMGGNLDV